MNRGRLNTYNVDEINLQQENHPMQQKNKRKTSYSDWSKSVVYFTIRPAARKGYGSIAHEAKPNGLLTHGP